MPWQVLVIARQSKNVPGRKTDVLTTSEGAWIYLSGDKDTVASSPQGMPVADEVAHLRTDARFVPAAAGHGIRAHHLNDCGTGTSRMPDGKCSTCRLGPPLWGLASAIRRPMRLRSGSGQAIVAAILQGERDPDKLEDLEDFRVKASWEEVVRSLEGGHLAAGERHPPGSPLSPSAQAVANLQGCGQSDGPLSCGADLPLADSWRSVGGSRGGAAA